MALECAVVRVTVPRAGRLTLDAVAKDGSTERPHLEICCESGDDVGGNPVSLTVAAGKEYVLLIGLGQGSSAPRAFIVKTTLEGSQE